eukprot:1184363-Prorocentrum_minimum.AAC.2
MLLYTGRTSGYTNPRVDRARTLVELGPGSALTSLHGGRRPLPLSVPRPTSCFRLRDPNLTSAARGGASRVCHSRGRIASSDLFQDQRDPLKGGARVVVASLRVAPNGPKSYRYAYPRDVAHAHTPGGVTPG